jgi:WD40 repeat protein
VQALQDAGSNAEGNGSPPEHILEGLDMTIEVTSPIRLERRLGYGRLQAATWIDDQTVLVATRASLWRWHPSTAATTSFASLGATLLSVNRTAGLAAVAVECPERELVVVSLADGQVIRRLPGHDKKLIKCVALSPDGRFLASGGSDRLLRIREIAPGAASDAEALTLEHPGGFSSMDGNPDVVAWSPDGAHVATADNQKRLWLWDAVTGARLAEWRLPLHARALTFSPDGQTLVAGLNFGGGTISRSDRFLAVVNARTGDILHTPDTPTEENHRGDNLWAVAYSPDGHFCAAGGDDGAIHIFDALTWQRVAHLPEPQHRIEPGKRITVSGLAYSPDGTRLLAVIASETNPRTGTVEYALGVWDTQTWALSARLDDFASTVNDLSLLPDGGLLAATAEGLRHYTEREPYTTLLPGKIHRVGAAPDGHYVVVGYYSFDGQAGLFDLQTGKMDEPLPGITKELVNSVVFLSDSQRYAICHSNYWLRKVGRKTAIKKLSPGDVVPRNRLSAATSSAGQVAIVSWQGTISLLWGDKFEHTIPPQAHPGDRRRLTAAAFAPDGQQVAAASGFYQRGVKSADRKGRIFVWQLPDMAVRELVTPQDNRWFEAIAWSPDGDRSWSGVIAAGTRNGLVCLFDAQSGDFAGEFAAHGAVITALLFTADGRRLITASEDGSIGVWQR